MYDPLSFLASFLPSFLHSFLPCFLPSFLPCFLPSFLPWFLPALVTIAENACIFVQARAVDSETKQHRLLETLKLAVRWMSHDTLGKPPIFFSEKTDVYAFGVFIWEIATYVCLSGCMDVFITSFFLSDLASQYLLRFDYAPLHSGLIGW